MTSTSEPPSWKQLPRERRIRIATRLICLLGAAVLLAWRCRAGASPLEVGAVFVVYVIVATLWVRGQYQQSLDAAREENEDLLPWTFPYWLSGSAFGAGLLVAVAGIILDNGTALIFGALGAYFGIGYVLMRYRMYRGNDGPARVTVGRWFLGVSTGLLVIGLFTLEYGGLLSLAATGIGLLISPVGPSILSEPTIRRLQAPGGEADVRKYVRIGAVLLVGSILVALIRVEHVAILIAFVALALLLLAIVSSTQADIAVVIAAVSLLGVTSMSEPKPNALRPQSNQGNVLLALGDSYMSGEGARIYYNEEQPDNFCHRAPTAWAAMAGRSELFDSVAFLACSGARTYNVRHHAPDSQDGNVPQAPEPATQLDQIETLYGKDFKPSLIVVSLGGNDTGFSTIGIMCLAPGDCSEKRELFEGNVGRLQKALSETFGEIRTRFPETPVLVTAYPAPIYIDPATKRPAACSEVALSAKDKQFISDFVPQLNAAVKAAAEAQKFHFLAEMEQSLAKSNLQLCDPANNKRPGINFIGLRSVGGVAEQRFNPKNWYHNSLHPNERGHFAMLQEFERWYAANPTPSAPGPPVAGAQSEAQTKTNPPCDLIKGDQSTGIRCLDEGVNWAKGQISATLFWRGFWGLQFALAALGAWLLGVALYGWWRPWWTRPDDDAE